MAGCLLNGERTVIKKIFHLILVAMLAGAAMAQDVSVRPDHPDEYVVVPEGTPPGPPRNVAYAYTLMADAAERAGARVVTQVDEEYPRCLLEIHDPPLAFYIRGELQDRDRQAVARKIEGELQYPGQIKVVVYHHDPADFKIHVTVAIVILMVILRVRFGGSPFSGKKLGIIFLDFRLVLH